MNTDLLSGDAMVLLRLLAAALAGVILGWPRQMSDKPIGMRTLGLVSLGAAMVTVAALRYAALAGHPDAISRVLQGIVQGLTVGVGFIGAGVILRRSEGQRLNSSHQ